MKKFFKIKPIDIKEITDFYSSMILVIALALFSHKLVYKTYAYFMFKNSYIAQINTPSYGEYTKTVLEEFNSMGDNKIISFTEKKYGRPIVIHDMPDIIEQANPETLGMAYPGLEGCTIFVKKKQFWMDYRETLLHEYLHCMGYEHTIYKNDLMYKYLIPVDKEQNIRYYANELRKKYYE